MKKTNYLIICTLLVLTYMFSSCEDENNDVLEDTSQEEIDPNENDPDENNILCIGNGTQDPLPLAIGNRWYFKKGLGGSAIEIKINETISINNKEYFRIEFTERLGSFNNRYERLYRKASNGDVFELITLSNNEEREYLVVPMNPANNQEWEYIGLLNDQNYKRKIRLVETNFPINTDACSYEKYIIVDEVSAGTSPTGNDEIITNDLYVRGIGFMYASGRELSELTLN